MKSMEARNSVICVLFLVFASVDSQLCNGGANCISLMQCTGLYSQLVRNGASDQLKLLLRSLHCGFGDINTPKVCCPPEFLNLATTTPYSAPSEDQPNNNKMKLLPDEKICGIQNNDRIVGGTETDIDEHPWLALLRYDKPYGWGFYCGGVLISERYVLTAAHCVVKGKDLPPNWNLSQVRLGEWRTSTTADCIGNDCANPVQDIPVETIIAHEKYHPQDESQHNDIALLRLTRPAQISDFVRPICLPLSSQLRQDSFVGYDMEVAGWGSTETSDEMSGAGLRDNPIGTESDIKLKVRVPVVGIQQCAQTYSRVNRTVDNTQICAGGVKGRDSCRGDSGGSLMGQASSANNWMAIGVVSYGPTPCGTEGWPGVYTRVGAYVSWILNKMQP